MPYVPESQRIDEIQPGMTPGQMNYIVTKGMLEEYAANPSYDTMAKFATLLFSVLEDGGTPRAMGAILMALLEFYRRIGTIHEEKAIARNGDLPEYLTALDSAKKR